MRRLLIIGCGDIALRALPLMRTRLPGVRARAQPGTSLASARGSRLRPVVGHLDKVGTLHVLSGLAHDVVHFAPPPPSGPHDTRTAHLIAALTKGKSLPQQLGYISTSGVHARVAIAGREHDGRR